MNCPYCKNHCIRKGYIKNIQRYRCKSCGRYTQKEYRRPRICAMVAAQVSRLVCEGMGISSISRYLKMAKSTVQRIMLRAAAQLRLHIQHKPGQPYEIDELRTYTRNKKNECWVMYSINKTTRQVVSVVTGRRTKENLRSVVNGTLKLQPSVIYTDKLNIYPTLIPVAIHCSAAHRINHIERMNLTLRTRLKRLSRKTICYSKSTDMLNACLQLYFAAQGQQQLDCA